ncbi:MULTISPECIES: DUF2971 domain-containing protein [unclassified Lacrimispora]|uniref:DUF2971 domain-containing protein n=1 Tax=unclassified Lacrimispora TaxID=2719232 RepID=UPI00377071A4
MILEHKNIKLKYSTIYKYLPLEEEIDNLATALSIKDYSSLSIDKKRLYGIYHGKIWFSKYGILGDPFEMKGFAYLKDKSEGLGLAQRLNNLFNEQSVAIASFTKSKNNLPLWAHYASNHKGYCLELEIELPKHVFPVTYHTERKKEYIYSQYTVNKQNMQEMNQWAEQLCRKAKQWDYEEEMRVIYYSGNGAEIDGNGILVNFNDFGLRLKRIIIGINCSNKNKKILGELARKLKIECSQAVLSSQKYEVFDRKLP